MVARMKRKQKTVPPTEAQRQEAQRLVREFWLGHGADEGAPADVAQVNAVALALALHGSLTPPELKVAIRCSRGWRTAIETLRSRGGTDAMAEVLCLERRWPKRWGLRRAAPATPPGGDVGDELDGDPA